MDLPFIYKYQPLLLDDFEYEDELLLLIRTLLKMDNLNIIFIGDSGCGKTSLINVIIREYYGKEPQNDNILIINSLKDQGITYYRNDVKIFCQTSSSIIGKKKILILDDIDNINEQSQQVFRNCIDKYSHNVHFISSCNNSQKVIDSIQSRLSVIKIKALHHTNLIKIINKISDKENILLDDECKKFILSISNNSIKILINYLEKLKLINLPITLELVSDVCTNITFKDFENFTKYCKFEKNVVNAVELIYKLFDKGYSVMDILDSYFLFVKTTNILTEDEKYKIIPIICKYITVFHNIHEDEIELALFTNSLIKSFTN
jgi:DNA polymerase III delta prime subunit